jgi:Neurotransmitter-gated ion-channel ligand binding domain.
MKAFILCLFLINFGIGYTSDIQQLKSNIYNNYNDINEDGINLKLSLAIRAFNNIDQIDGSINMNIWLRYEWYDKNIMWNPNDYNNITSVNLDTNLEYDHYMWTPDVYLYNTAEKPMAELDFTKANVYSNGRECGHALD